MPMEDYIMISQLNDFIFCPYSIYGGDSVIVFDVSGVKLRKYGNAIHRDVDIVYL